jgi:hypothetical protein
MPKCLGLLRQTEPKEVQIAGLQNYCPAAADPVKFENSGTGYQKSSGLEGERQLPAGGGKQADCNYNKSAAGTLLYSLKVIR